MNIFALRVKFRALNHGIENAKVGRCISPATRGPLPAKSIVGQIRIDQFIPKPGGSFAPAVVGRSVGGEASAILICVVKAV